MSYFPCRLEQTGLLQAGVRAEEDGGSAGAGGNGQTVCTLQTSGQNLLIETDTRQAASSNLVCCGPHRAVLTARRSFRKCQHPTAQRYITQGESHES